MSEIKLKMLQKEIAKIDKRINKIDFLISAMPMSEIIKLREAGRKLLNEKQEKYWYKIVKEKEDSIKLIDEKVELSFAKTELVNDLYWYERKLSQTTKNN